MTVAEKNQYLNETVRRLGIPASVMYAFVLGHAARSIPDEIWLEAVDKCVEWVIKGTLRPKMTTTRLP